MRKLIVTVVISAFLGMPSLATGKSKPGFYDNHIISNELPGIHHPRSKSYVPPKSYVSNTGNDIGYDGNSFNNLRIGGSYGMGTHYTASASKLSQPAPKTDLKANLPKEQLEVAKQQLKQLENVYGSLMASHNKQKSLAMLGNDSDLFFKNPQFIYDQGGIDSKISDLFKSVEQKNKLQDDSAISMRETIRARSKYAAEMDQTVSLRVFEETENRFKKINELLAQAEKTGNLKDAADLQAKIVGTLTMIQNEATKLQMILHQRNAEKILIDQQKLTRNVKILSSHNLSMPTIRHTSPR
ncbi:type IV secretion system protein [Bartonella sp. B30(2025)]